LTDDNINERASANTRNDTTLTFSQTDTRKVELSKNILLKMKNDRPICLILNNPRTPDWPERTSGILTLASTVALRLPDRMIRGLCRNVRDYSSGAVLDFNELPYHVSLLKMPLYQHFKSN